MNFTDYGYFLWFLPITILVVKFLGKEQRDRQIGILLLSSWIFFWFSSGWYLVLLFISTIVDWNTGYFIHQSKDARKRKYLLTISLVANLGLLGIFKYLDFFVGSVNHLLDYNGNSFSFEKFNLILPVGISFYTFQTMSYTFDIYRKKRIPMDSFLSFACYAAFFPQLVAGPIVRSEHFENQIKEPLIFKSKNFRIGLTFILIGLLKKLVVADNVGVQVNYILNDGEHIQNSLLVWWAALLFGIQIYADFSGYTDIALGSAKIFGIDIPKNFDYPYFAANPQEFWRKWHISLSTWLRDYLYISLGGNRGGIIVLIKSLMLTMILGGLWHGANWNFILWGFVHGLLLLSHRFFNKYHEALNKIIPSNKVKLFVSWLITQYFIFFTWLIFRVQDFELLKKCISSYLFIGSRIDFMEYINYLEINRWTTFLIVFFFIIFHTISYRIGGIKYFISKDQSVLWGFYMGIILSLIYFFGPESNPPFIYFQF